MRLSYQRIDRAGGFSSDVCRYLEAHNGRPTRSHREAYDSQFDEAGTQEMNGLWSIPTQIANREAQAQRRSEVQ